MVLAGGFCTFLIGANYYYAQRATYLLERIRTLPLDDSAVTELKALGSEHGFRYEEATNCGKSPCIHTVAPNNLWMQHILTSRFTASLGRLLGLRAWLAVGDIELEQQQVIGKVYGLAFFEGRFDPAIQVTAWEERKFGLTQCAYYPVKRHPGYGFRNADNIRSFRAEISLDTLPENRERAFQFGLQCLTSRHRCDQFSDLMPAAWTD
ncbi:MAG TPA: hypothetical protein VFA40_06645 [Terriglobales bacterium]|nr:hypothetical protein [Terriglobales bacterium]